MKQVSPCPNCKKMAGFSIHIVESFSASGKSYGKARPFDIRDKSYRKYCLLCDTDITRRIKP